MTLVIGLLNCMLCSWSSNKCQSVTSHHIVWILYLAGLFGLNCLNMMRHHKGHKTWARVSMLPGRVSVPICCCYAGCWHSRLSVPGLWCWPLLGPALPSYRQRWAGAGITSHHHQPRSRRHQHLLTNIAQYIALEITKYATITNISGEKIQFFPWPPTPNITSDFAIQNKSETVKISVFFALCWNFGQI